MGAAANWWPISMIMHSEFCKLLSIETRLAWAPFFNDKLTIWWDGVSESDFSTPLTLTLTNMRCRTPSGTWIEHCTVYATTVWEYRKLPSQWINSWVYSHMRIVFVRLFAYDNSILFYIFILRMMSIVFLQISCSRVIHWVPASKSKGHFNIFYAIPTVDEFLDSFLFASTVWSICKAII